jgi:hypothetical protein
MPVLVPAYAVRTNGGAGTQFLVDTVDMLADMFATEEHTKVLFVDSIFVLSLFGVTGNVGLGRFYADAALPKASRRVSMAG